MRLPGGEAPGTKAAGPEVGMVYWVDTTILPSGDPEWQRPVVVIDVPATVDGTVVVVSRSAVDGFGVADVAGTSGGDGGGGRGGGGGRYSRRHPVQGRRWTSAHVTPIGRLDPDVFAAVIERFSSPS